MTSHGGERTGRRAAPAAPSAGSRSRAVAAVLALATAVLGGWLWLSRSADLVDKTREIERSLLAGGSPGRAARRAVDEIMRTVDRMGPEEVREVQLTLDEEWQRVRKQDVEAYFAAKSDEKNSILDRSIDRALVYGELRFAVNPKARDKQGRRSRKPRSSSRDAPGSGGATAADDAAQRQLLERYDDALRQRARERRIELPAWQ